MGETYRSPSKYNESFIYLKYFLGMIRIIFTFHCGIVRLMKGGNSTGSGTSKQMQPFTSNRREKTG